VIEFGPSNDRWAWKVKTSDGRIGITYGNCLVPLKKKYQYSLKAKIGRDGIIRLLGSEGYSGQLKLTKGQIVEVDKSYSKWSCLPAKLNDVERFVLADFCTFI